MLHSHSSFVRRSRFEPWGLSLFLLAAFLLSGGGKDYPLNEAIVKGMAVLVLGYYAAGLGRGRPSREAWRSLLLLALFALVPLVQLIPTPFSFWSGLQGRSLVIDISDAARIPLDARPASLDPAATARSLSALLPFAAMLVATLHLPRPDRVLLARFTVSVALCSLLLGAVQYASGGTVGVLYPSAHSGYPTGFFTNRNHQADFLLLAIILAAPALSPRDPRAARAGQGLSRLFPAAGTALLLAAGVVATTSRMGVVLLPFSLCAFVLLLRGGGLGARSLALVGLIALAGLLVALLGHDTVVDRVLSRLGTGDVRRLGIWQDTLWAADRYWPAGTGVGTFASLFPGAEALDHVGPLYVNHAHDEYLELLLEAGVAAPVLLLATLAWLAAAIAGLARMDRADRSLALAGLFGMGVVLLHSLVDYPARMLSIGMVLAMLAGFAAPPPVGRQFALTGAGRRVRELPTR